MKERGKERGRNEVRKKNERKQDIDSIYAKL